MSFFEEHQPIFFDETIIDKSLLLKKLHALEIERLSQSDWDYIHALAKCHNTKEIANSINRTSRTVDEKIRELKKRFDLNSRSDLINLAKILSDEVTV
ncbi:helix-turn-helix transcriptional regulator [Piscirickettsia litoralis]|uniref:HTH luxR-type domain-containing protein n=1 Tax=Piscirickettsia litoralis TaxID=1891921 RepID=A0ABX3A230_9GAMM|nr:LuxR C-terminal-related transcriptional regulator [Piscirickettsia litoralis]ODN41721.1 hypothetical protein BGC07_00375 [Piscirickettsia litoralis]